MVEKCGFESLDALIDATVPASIRRKPMQLGEYNKGYTESGILKKLRCAPACRLLYTSLGAETAEQVGRALA